MIQDIKYEIVLIMHPNTEHILVSAQKDMLHYLNSTCFGPLFYAQYPLWFSVSPAVLAEHTGTDEATEESLMALYNKITKCTIQCPSVQNGALVFIADIELQDEKKMTACFTAGTAIRDIPDITRTEFQENTITESLCTNFPLSCRVFRVGLAERKKNSWCILRSTWKST